MIRPTAGAALAALGATFLVAGLLPGSSAVGANTGAGAVEYRNPVSESGPHLARLAGWLLL